VTTVNEPRKRAALYTRISTDEEHQPWSLPAQRERLRAYCKAQDWTIVETYSDQASGATLKRPGIQRAVADARLGGFDLLLSVRVDRLSRNLAQLAHLADVLKEVDVALVSATEPFDTGSPTGRMLFQMLGSFAEFERALIIDRVRAGMARRAKSGYWPGGPIPFGYEREPETKQLVEDALKASIVRKIFRLYTRDRLGTQAIARILNEASEAAPGRRAWTRQKVAGVLHNKAYVGLVAWDGELHDGKHPALIERQMFDAAERLLRERREHPALRRRNPSPYVLSGLLLCKRCKSPYIGTYGQGTGGRYEYYRCKGRQLRGRSYCDNDTLPRRPLESVVLTQLSLLLSDTKLLERAWANAHRDDQSRQGELRAELSRTRSRAIRIEEKRRRYFHAFEDGVLEPAAFKDRLAELESELSRLRSQESRVERELAANARPSPAPVDLIGELKCELDATSVDDAPRAKALLRVLIAELAVFSRHDIRPTYRLPLHSDRYRLVGLRVEDGAFPARRTGGERS
jgi:site-specific DNA recombinase